MKKKSKYGEMPLQTISRKVWSSLIDGLLLLVLGVVLTITAGFSVLKNNETFKLNNTKCFDNIALMYEMQSETRLQTLIDETKVLSNADYFDDYIIKQIRLSYLKFTSDFNNQGINLEIKENNYSTLENDELSYYFISYKLQHDINTEDYGDKDSLTYFKDDILFKNINKEYYEDVINDLPVIKSEIAISLYKHYSDIEHNTNLYYEFSDAVLAIRNIGLSDLATDKTFLKYYNDYEAAYLIMSKYENITLLICFIISYFLLIGIPNIISKNGMSIGKLLTRTRIIHQNDNDIGLLRRVAITLLSLLTYIITILVISLFTFGFGNLTNTLFYVGSSGITFLHLLLVGFMIMVTNFIFISVSNDHRSLIDYITSTKNVDITTYIN